MLFLIGRRSALATAACAAALVTVAPEARASTVLTPFAPYVTSFSAGEITCIGLLCGVASGPYSRSLAFSVNAPANMTDLHIEVVAESSAEFPPQGSFRGVSLDSLRLLSPPLGGLGLLIHIFGTGARSSFDTLSCSAAYARDGWTTGSKFVPPCPFRTTTSRS